MRLFDFIYNVGMIVLYTVNITGFLTLFLKNRSKASLWCMVLFTWSLISYATVFLCSVVPGLQYIRDPAYLNSYPMIVLQEVYTIVRFFCFRMVVHILCMQPLGKVRSLIWTASAVVILLISILVRSAAGFIVNLAIYTALIIDLWVCGIQWVSQPDVRMNRTESVASLLRILFIVLLMSYLVSGIGALNKYMVGNSSSVLDDAAEQVRSVLLALSGIGYLVVTIVNSQRRSASGAQSPKEQASIVAVACGLTSRETELLPLLMSGMSNQEIGETAFIAVGTVKVHVYNIFRKLGIKKRNQVSEAVQTIVGRRRDG